MHTDMYIRFEREKRCARSVNGLKVSQEVLRLILPFACSPMPSLPLVLSTKSICIT